MIFLCHCNGEKDNKWLGEKIGVYDVIFLSSHFSKFIVAMCFCLSMRVCTFLRSVTFANV